MGDPRLGRRVQFDERSRSFPIREILPVIHKPRSYTWQCIPVLNQGMTSSCVGHAIAHEAAARPVSVPNVTHEIAMDIYHRALQLDPWPGEEDNGTSVLAGMKAAMERGWYLGYKWAFNLLDVIDTLGYFGPVIFGIPWYTGMMQTDSSGIIRPTGIVEGGHAICGRGNIHKKSLVRLRQSWGDWGIGGDCFIHYDDLDRLLHEQGECMVPIKRGYGSRT